MSEVALQPTLGFQGGALLMSHVPIYVLSLAIHLQRQENWTLEREITAP